MLGAFAIAYILIAMIKTLCALATRFTLACWIDWEKSPSYVDKNGILHEPFALVSLGATGALTTATTGSYQLIQKALT